MKKLQNAVCLVLVVMLLAASGCSIDTSAQGPDGIFISEVVSSNANSLTDPIFGNPDWLEIHNATDVPVSLLGYSLVESGGTYTFPDVTIGPGEYLVVYCCKVSGNVDTDKLCTGFKLSKQGSSVTFSSPSGVIQRLDVPELVQDISYGIDGAGEYKFFAAPTPGAPNDTAAFDSLEDMKSRDADLKITEVLPYSASSDWDDAWIEICNMGDEAVELSGFYVTDDLSDPTKARLPQMRLEPGAYAVVTFTGEMGEGQVPIRISDTETVVAVMDSFGEALDVVIWDEGVIPGISVGKAKDGSTIYYMTPTPGAPNGSDYTDSISFTEGMGAVRINEVLVNNTYSIIDGDGERSPWVELYNASDGPVNLGGYALSDNENKILKWKLPDYQLEPGAYVVVFLSGKDVREGDEWHTGFKLSGSDRQLILTDIRAGTFQKVALAEDIGDNIAYGLAADGRWLYYPQPTPMAANETQGFAEIAAVTDAADGGLRISEVAAVSKAKSGDPDWVELYNGTDKDVDLTGYYLSDSRRDLKKWPIDGLVLKANGYGVVREYEKDGETGELTISLSGETVYLVSPQGLVLDQIQTGVLRPGLSHGLVSTATGFEPAVFQTPTPGEANKGETVSGYCAAPAFSVNGGYQSAPVTLEMNVSTPDATIYYTLDGSTPSKSATPYTGPVTIDQTQTVRAVAVAPGRLASEETVATYLFEERHSLPVVCLSMTQRDLNYVFGSATRLDIRERAGYVEYYEADGTLGVRFPAGFRIAGAGTRTYPQKSINLYLRGGYGRSSVTYPFFEGYDITTFKSLSLRNMGQDNSSTRLRDAFFHMAVNGMKIDNMQTKFAVVYINGEYWGLYEFKENQNEDYLASKYGIDPDKVEMARSNTYAYEGSSRNIKNLFAMARGNTSDAEKFAAYTALADEEYFTDYLIATSFFINDDVYNQKYAHTSDNVLKWRPLFYDLDLALDSSLSVNVLSKFFRSTPVPLGKPDEEGNQNFMDPALFYAFYKNREWRDQFVERYAEVLNTVLTTDRLLEIYDAMVEAVRDEMPRTIERWGWPSSMSKWESEVEDLRENIENRREYAIAGLKSYFNLSNAEVQALFPNG